MQSDASIAGAADAGRYKVLMRILAFFLGASILACANAASALNVGESYDTNLKTLVETSSLESVTSEIDLDINLDGRNEIGFGVTCGNAGCDYYLFERVNENRSRFIGNIFFHPKSIIIDPKTRLITTFVRSNASEGCNITYTLSSIGFEKQNHGCD